jgi:hypothetical protein
MTSRGGIGGQDGIVNYYTLTMPQPAVNATGKQTFGTFWVGGDFKIIENLDMAEVRLSRVDQESANSVPDRSGPTLDGRPGQLRIGNVATFI